VAVAVSGDEPSPFCVQYRHTLLSLCASLEMIWAVAGPQLLHLVSHFGLDKIPFLQMPTMSRRWADILAAAVAYSVFGAKEIG
jgi:hypothetical protein